jgi:hypothetical protein
MQISKKPFILQLALFGQNQISKDADFIWDNRGKLIQINFIINVCILISFFLGGLKSRL